MTGKYPMTAARKANPVPASTTVSAFAPVARGTTSPRPSVKKVVPLMYTSDQNPVAPPPRQESGGTAPGHPGGSVEQLGESDPPAHPPGQDDRLEGIPQHHREQQRAGETAQPSHGYFHD